jgi:hypothetical protein
VISISKLASKSGRVMMSMESCGYSVQDALGAAEDGVLVVEVTKVTREEDRNQLICILLMLLWFDVLQSNALPEIQRRR